MNTETKHTPEWYVDKKLLGVIRRTEDPLCGIVVGMRAQHFADALNNYPDMAKEIAQLRADKMELVSALKAVDLFWATQSKDCANSKAPWLITARNLIKKHTKV